MDRLQDISRLLLAAGGTPSRDGKTTHLTYEKEGSIRMRTWTGSELTDDELITDEARRGTSAPIVNRRRKKVFVVHKNDSIKCFIDPLRDDDQVEEDEMNDDAPWNEEEIIGVDTRVHPQSQLAVSYDKNTVFIFYQKPDGSLSGINEYNDKWKAIELPTVAALNGTPLATCNTNSAVFLFYMSVDGTVRYIENSEDVFFSSAEIIDPDEKLPGTALKLTIAEDRQAFERIRPLRFITEDESEEADSEGTEEESGSEGRASEEAETDPSEIEEGENEEDQTEEARCKEAQIEEVQDEEIQTEEVQDEEIQTEEIQDEEIQDEEIQDEEAQTKRAQDAQKDDAKLEEFEAKVSKTGESGTKGQEPRDIKCEEIRPVIAADKDEVPPAETSTTKLRLPIVKSSTTERRSKEPDVEEPGLENLDPEESERTEIPTLDKRKGPAATNTPISKELRFNTPQEIQEDMNNHIEKIGLDSIFPKDSPYTRAVADNAMKLQDSKENLLHRVDDIRFITILNLYQPVLYCDDSTSMRANTRVEDQKEMVRRVTRISTSIVPPGYGTSLQFINFVRDVHDDKLSQKEVEAIMNSVKPSGHTKIGTNLKEKILKPLVYDVIKSNRRLERPILVSCITDGCPSDESVDTFRKEILKCTRFLKENGYPSSMLRFQISQIGNSSRADKFLKKLSRDDELKEVLFCTAQRLDEQFEMLRDNETKLERWVRLAFAVFYYLQDDFG
ncbi:hypothetical protein ACSS6W_009190 [Trichoderma asperelloides]